VDGELDRWHGRAIDDWVGIIGVQNNGSQLFTHIKTKSERRELRNAQMTWLLLPDLVLMKWILFFRTIVYIQVVSTCSISYTENPKHKTVTHAPNTDFNPMQISAGSIQCCPKRYPPGPAPIKDSILARKSLAPSLPSRRNQSHFRL